MKKVILLKKVILSALFASLAVASPPGTPTQREVLRDWYCGHCFDEFRRECADCYEFWYDNDEMALRCINGHPREDFMACISLCPFTPAIYGDIIALYDDGLLDSWGVVEAIQALQ